MRLDAMMGSTTFICFQVGFQQFSVNPYKKKFKRSLLFFIYIIKPDLTWEENTGEKKDETNENEGS